MDLSVSLLSHSCLYAVSAVFIVLQEYMQAAKVVFYRVDSRNQCFRTVINGRPLTLPVRDTCC